MGLTDSVSGGSPPSRVYVWGKSDAPGRVFLEGSFHDSCCWMTLTVVLWIYQPRLVLREVVVRRFGWRGDA
jgi:hypothetical protein